MLTVKCIVKAYLQKKGTTTMKCATSAEANVFGQAVVLCIAVNCPNSPKVSSARLMTPSGGNNGFHNETFGYYQTP